MVNSLYPALIKCRVIFVFRCAIEEILGCNLLDAHFVVRKRFKLESPALSLSHSAALCSFVNGIDARHEMKSSAAV
jgi:hypothetical protein